MKKIISAVLISIMILSIFTVRADDSMKLSDIQNHWAKSNIEQLIRLGVIDGYTDGTFKPDNTLKFEEFIKMLVTATIEKKELEVYQLSEDKWYDKYMNAALANEFITWEMFTDFIGKNINRGDMAEIIYNFINTTNEKMEKLNVAEIKFVSDKFSDLKMSDEKILNIAAIGIINGYTDGTFKPENNLKRAEATTVILRILDESKRTPMEIVLSEEMKELADFPEPDLDYLREYPCHIWNKPNTVAELNGRVSDSYSNDEIVQVVTNFMDLVSNIDHNKFSLESMKKPFIYALHNSVEYRGKEYQHLSDGEYPINDGYNWLDLFLEKYVKDVKDNKIKIEGKYFTAEDLCILHNNTPTSRGILRFKIESANDLELVKHILFIRDTEREKLDTSYAKSKYGGVDNSRYIKNSEIKLELDTWYEVAMDITVNNVLKPMDVNVYKNYETSDYRFAYICPIYIRELK